MANAILRLAVSMSPSHFLISVEKVVTSVLLAVASITTQATLADVSNGADLAMNSAKVGICAGLSFVVGPILGGVCMKKFGPRASYFVASMIAAVHIAFAHFTFRETLMCEDRRPMRQTFVSPFSFTRLLTTKSRPLRMLTIIGLLQTFCEPKTWNDMVQLYMRVNVRLGASSIGRFFATFGMSAILAKLVTRRVIKRYGFAFHTKMANVATALAFSLWGCNASSRLTSVAAPLLLAPLFMDRRAGVTVRANDAAVAVGLGKGEHAGLFGNLRALAVVFAPLIFGNIYSWSSATTRRPTGLPFIVAAMFAVAAEATHTSLLRYEERTRRNEDSRAPQAKNNDA
eukprot:g1421.t1